MSRNPIDVAKEKIAFHEGEISRLKRFLNEAESILLDASSLTSTATPLTTDAEVKVAPRPRLVLRRDFKPSSSTTEILKQSEDVLQLQGKPMSAGEIYEMVVRRGVRIGGQNPKGNLTAKFATAKDVFVFDKDSGLWSLATWKKNKEAFDDLLGKSP
jgi:hypothetical protein